MARDIARFLAEGWAEEGRDAQNSIVLSTYDSLEKVAHAERLLARLARWRRRVYTSSFCVSVFDEAHYMAGSGVKYSLGLDDEQLRLTPCMQASTEGRTPCMRTQV